MKKIILIILVLINVNVFAQQEIKEVADEMGFKVGNFERRPIDGLVPFHTKSL
jgi:hypothetical protein